MICIIRIRGNVGLKSDVIENFNRLRLKRKYACVVIKKSPENLGMINKVKNFVAFGEIDDETFEKLIEARGKALNKTKKVDSKKAVAEINDGASYEKVNLKPFFRLHPPRGGIETKQHYPKGVLGNHKEHINKLVERML